MNTVFHFRPIKSSAILFRKFADNIKSNVPPIKEVPKVAKTAGKPPVPPVKPAKKGHGLLYTSIIIGVPAVCVIAYRTNKSTQNLVAEKIPAIQPYLRWALPEYHTPSTTLSLSCLAYLSLFYNAVEEQCRTFYYDDAISSIKALGFTGEEKACKKLETRSVSVVPGSSTSTGFVGQAIDLITPFWYPESVINKDQTQLTVIDFVLLLEQCMAETGITEQQIITKISGLHLHDQRGKVNNTLMMLEPLKPDTPNYATRIIPYVDLVVPPITSVEKKSAPKQVEPIIPPSKPLESKHPEIVLPPKPQVTEKPKSSSKMWYYAGGIGATIAIAAILLSGKSSK